MGGTGEQAQLIYKHRDLRSTSSILIKIGVAWTETGESHELAYPLV